MGTAGQTVLSAVTEELLVNRLLLCAEWVYPMDSLDLRIIVKGYLDRQGFDMKKFMDNLPGPDWVLSFMEKHKEKLTQRICQNNKRYRASVSPEIVIGYFNNLEHSLGGVPVCNIMKSNEILVPHYAHDIFTSKSFNHVTLYLSLIIHALSTLPIHHFSKCRSLTLRICDCLHSPQNVG